MTLRYDAPSSRCMGKCQYGVVALYAAMSEHWPFLYNLGCYSCRNVGGTSSPSAHREGRAQDLGVRMKNRSADPKGWEPARWLVENANPLSVQVVIWDRKIWSVGRRLYGWRNYDGQSPHLDHIHVELNWDGARSNTNKTYTDQLAHPAPVEPPEDDMTPVPLVNTPTIYTTEDGGWYLWEFGTTHTLTQEALGHFRNIGYPQWPHPVDRDLHNWWAQNSRGLNVPG